MKTLKNFILENDDNEHHATVVPLTGFSPFSHMGHAQDLGEKMRQLPGAKHIGISQKSDVYTPQERGNILHKQWRQPDLQVHHANSGGEVVSHAFHSLPKKGRKVLHILVGHDRKGFAEGLKKSLEAGKIKEMNGHKWDEIHIHHPDDTGRSHGMSGTNMRRAASNGNIGEFHRHLGPMFSRSEATKHMNRVKRALDSGQIKLKREDVLYSGNMLSEGVHDHGIFKAVIMSGGSGSGKDFVLKNTLDGHGLTEINSDNALEYLMGKHGLSKQMPTTEEEKRDHIRKTAKNLTELRRRLALMGRNGLIINGTGDEPEKIAKIKDHLGRLGYDTHMIMVHTSNEVSRQRNIERGQAGGRTVPEHIRQQKWEGANNARPKYAEMFGPNYSEFDNSADLRNAPPEIVKAKKQEMLDLHKKIGEFITSPPTSLHAQNWIANELAKRDTAPVKKVAPHPSRQEGEQAKKQGLEYYGHGRYGREGKVTHRAYNGKLLDTGSMREKAKESTKQKNEHIKGDTKYEVIRENHGLVRVSSKQSRTSSINECSPGTTSSTGRSFSSWRKTSSSPSLTKESIDKGIEPGIALNSYAKEKIRKKDGKVTMVELTGDETTASISDQKENELKQKGINLKTFKSKKFIG